MASEYKHKFAKQNIKVNGEDVEVLILGEGADLPIGSNLSEEMSRVSALMAYWSSVLAEAESEQVKVDAWYRRFRASIKNKFGDAKGMSDWKLNAKIESSDGFLSHKEAVAQAQKNVALCSGMVKAFEKKANMLQSIGAHARSEINAQGIRTPTTTGWNLSGDGSDSDDEVTDPSSSEDALERMKRINKNRRDKKRNKG